MSHLLEVTDLTIETTGGGRVLSHTPSLTLDPGELVGIVGESGSGKTVAIRAIAGLPVRGTSVTSGRVRFRGNNVDLTDPEARDRVLRDHVGFVFQNPFTSLNPRLRVAEQIREGLPSALRRNRRASDHRIEELLELVGLPQPAEIARRFPYQLSGGQSQRIVIATALAKDPALLLADEPTTALDVLVQHQVLDLLDDLRERLDLGIVLVSHDMGIIEDRADKVHVLKDGRTVEQGPTAAIIGHPSEETTRDLLASIPRLDAPSPLLSTATEMDIRTRELSRRFGRGSQAVDALVGVNLEIARGEQVAIVGASGSGKTTLARIIAGLDTGHTGELELPFLSPSPWRWSRTVTAADRRDVQYIFQDPYSSLHPRRTVRQTLEEALRPRRGFEENRSVEDLVAAVHLPVDRVDEHPASLSGGQRQRVGIARALATRPRVLLADEPVSALDLTVQRRVLDLLGELRRELGSTLLFVTHDLAIAKEIAGRVVVGDEEQG
jgi:peptide/nickel transport system ATP-binding protein